MIYKRGCNKKGPNGTCSKCGTRGSCGVYWFKFLFDCKLIRESTRKGNDKTAREMEAARRIELVQERREKAAARARLQCADVLRCHECEILFNVEKAIKKNT